MRFLICGLGSIGRRHLRNLRSLGQEEIVLLRTGKSTLPEDELPSYPVEQDIETALENWDPEAVLVTNPTALHLAVALPAAKAGCHLFLEKPLSHGMQGVEDLVAAVSRGGGKSLVGFQFRFHPGLRQVKQLVSREEIGRVISAQAHWGEYLPGWHPWEDYRRSYSARADLGGGVVLTLSHPFDYLRWIVGEVVQVQAQTGRLGDLAIEVEDTAQVILRFQNDALGSVYLDYNQRPPSHWLEIIGTQGTIHWEDSGRSVRWWSADSRGWQEIENAADFVRNTLFMDEMRHFLEVIQGEREPLCTLEDGIRALEISLAVHRSAAEGRTVQLSTGP